MPTGSGLDSQLGTKTETTVGTLATPVTQFFPFNTFQLTFDPTYISNPAIVAGKRFIGVSQAAIARKSASGTGQIPIMSKGFGWWMKHIMGSTANPVQIGVTTAYKQIHTPGGLRGLSFTAQIGKPDASGTVNPRTYNGCKISDWTITLEDNAIHLLDMTVDAWNEDTATTLASAVYPTGNQAFTFANVTNFKVGGTPSTTAGETTVASGVAPTSVVTKLVLTGKAALANDRYGLGNAGIKKEQLEKDHFFISGAFEGEFDATTWETPLRAGTTTALQYDSSFGDAGGGNPYLFSIIIPAAKITSAPAPVNGPDLVRVSGTFDVYDPELTDGTPPIQIKIVSTDSAAW